MGNGDFLREMRAEITQPSRPDLAPARERLMQQIRSPRKSVLRRVLLPGRSMTRMATVGGLSVALAGALLTSQTVDFSGPPTDIVRGGGKAAGGPAAVANADMLLTKAAAASPNYSSVQPDDYTYVETKTVSFGLWAEGGDPAWMRQKEWLSVSGSRPGLLRSKVSSADKAMLIPDVKADPGRPKEISKWQDQRLAPEDDPQHPWQPDLFRPNYSFLKSLPHDPDALANKVVEACAERGCTHGGFNLIRHILADHVVPPEVRSGLLEAAKRIEGIRLIENVRLAATGERGVALAYRAGVNQEAGGSRFELVFDAQTYRILGTQRVKVSAPPPTHHPGAGTHENDGRASDDDDPRGTAALDATPSAEPPPKRWEAEPGTVVSSTAIIEKGIVDKIGQQP